MHLIFYWRNGEGDLNLDVCSLVSKPATSKNKNFSGKPKNCRSVYKSRRSVVFCLDRYQSGLVQIGI